VTENRTFYETINDAFREKIKLKNAVRRMAFIGWYLYMAPVYRMLAVDIDGTLINKDDQISAANRAALGEAAAIGVQVSLCTGRSIGSAGRFIQELDLVDNIHVFFDGALVTGIQEAKPVYIESMTPDLVRDMVAYADERMIDIELASVERYFARRETWSTRTKREFFSIDTTIGPFDAIWDREPIIRADIVIRSPEENKRTDLFIKDFFGRVQFSEAFSPRYPGVRFINVISSGLSKGRALQALAGRLGMELSDVMAVGDWLNDIPMLTAAGFGVAMGNAHEEVKKAADATTLSVEEDGLAAAIRKYLL